MVRVFWYRVVGFFLSIAVHALLLSLLFVAFRFEKKSIDLKPAISIEVIDVQSVAQLAPPQVSKEPPAPKKTVPAKVAPKKETPSAKPVVKKTVSKNPVPVKKPSPQKKKIKPATKSKKTLDDILAKNQAKPKKGKQKTKSRHRSSRSKKNQAVLEELAKKKQLIFSIQQQIMACWQISSENVRNASDVVVAVLLRLDKDGYILTARTLRHKSTFKHPHFHEVEQSVHRAFDNPKCKPLHLPAEMYDTWKEVSLRFSPQ